LIGCWDSILGQRRGPMSAGEARGGEGLAAIGDSDGAIQMRVDVDAGAGEAAPSRPGAELDEAAIQLDRVIVLDGAAVFEATHAREGGPRWCGAPGGGRVRGGVGEAGIVTGEQAVDDALGLGERARLGESQFNDEAILEGAEEALNPTLRLWGVSPDPRDAEFLKRPSDLGLPRDAAELVVEGERRVRIRAKDPMAIRVDCGREAVAADELTEEEEIAVGVLLRAKHGAQDTARGIVDGGEEHEAGAAVLEPRMVAAIELDKEARLRHALPAATMPGGPAGTGTANAGSAQEPLHRAAREPDSLAFGEQFGEVVIIHAGVASPGEGDDLGPQCGREAPGRGTAAVAMSEGDKALLAQTGEKPADVSQRESQELGSGPSGQGPVLDLSDDMHSLLLLLSQGDRLPGHFSRVTDSLAR
jgi:hypothetical protein